MKGHRGPTLADVARHAGVSPATASRALDGRTKGVRADVRARVASSAADLGYTVNWQAQAVARGRTNVLGLIVHDIADPYFASIAAGVMSTAGEVGLVVTLATSRGLPELEAQHVAMLRAQRARGLIVVGSRHAPFGADAELGRELAAFRATGGRATIIGQDVGLEIDTIACEDGSGAAALATSMIGLGHRRHAILAGPPGLMTARDRMAGYREVVASSGRAEAPIVVHSAFTRDGGYDAMEELVPRLDAIDCVFAVSDAMAVGAIAALRSSGLQVPRDVAIAGFEDITTLRDVAPGLTTVRLPLAEMGEHAVRLALQDPGAPARTRRVEGGLVLRESTPAVHSVAALGPGP